MRILHLLNWPLEDIKREIPKISEQGFDAVQINPIQPLKEEDCNEWWMSYQPIDFSIGNKFGSKKELINLCNIASEFNIKIIADVVCNHMAQNNDGSLRPHEKVSNRLKERNDFWKEQKNISNWDDRNQVINYCLGLPGLNVCNHDLQDIIIDFLNELVDCGVEGFRFDAAKHIALPQEGCDFWPRIIYCLKKYGLFIYGEVIFSAPSLIKDYCKYLNVVTNSYCPNNNQIIGFVESHDTFYGFGYTRGKNSGQIASEYREICKQYGDTLFYARPYDDAWKSDDVRIGNNIGKKQYCMK